MSDTRTLALTSQIVAAHIAHNDVTADKLPDLIRSVHQALATVDSPAPAAEEAPVPAVPIRKSVFPDYIVCLEDGAKLKMLKRYLQARFGMTPADYRAKWGLPSDYPMVAPGYREKRSEMAKSLGLGRKREMSKQAIISTEPETQEAEPQTTTERARQPRRGK